MIRGRCLIEHVLPLACEWIQGHWQTIISIQHPRSSSTSTSWLEGVSQRVKVCNALPLPLIPSLSPFTHTCTLINWLKDTIMRRVRQCKDTTPKHHYNHYNHHHHHFHHHWLAAVATTNWHKCHYSIPSTKGELSLLNTDTLTNQFWSVVIWVSIVHHIPLLI